jgi:hypothetical protein
MLVVFMHRKGKWLGEDLGRDEIVVREEKISDKEEDKLSRTSSCVGNVVTKVSRCLFFSHIHRSLTD